jgi:tetratricopeptide (TPR) repeat protein
MSIRAVPLAVLFLVTLSLAADPSGAIADLYVESGMQAFEQGEYEQALMLAEQALDFAPDSSDAHTLAALVYARQQAGGEQAIAHLELALDANSFSRYVPAVATISLGSLLNRTGESQRAASILGELSLPATLDWGLRADYWNALIQAYADSGQLEDADAALEGARDLHPNDARIAAHELAREPLPSLEYRLEIERLIAERSRERELDDAPELFALQQLVLDYGLAVDLPSEREWAAEQYISLNGAHPMVSVLYLDSDPNQAFDLFSELDGAASIESALAYAERDSVELITPVLEQFTGVAFLDADLDGFWEQEHTVLSGMVTRIRRDRDQNGSVELDIAIGEGNVRSARLETPRAAYEFKYLLYPFVNEVSVITDDGKESFVLEPRRVSLRLLEVVPADGLRLSQFPEVLDEIRVPQVSELRERAVRVDRYDDDGVRRVRTYQASGEMVFTGVDENGDGVFDLLTLQEGGFPTRQVRDIDFDLYFEVVEEFRGGRRVARAVDEDDDGFPEILEYERSSSIRDWDLNHDGRIDVREFLNWGDSVIREFPFLEQR